MGQVAKDLYYQNEDLYKFCDHQFLKKVSILSM